MNKFDNVERMTSSSIPQLIFILSIPAIISNLISNFYNLVDTYFVGTLGISASGAVGIVFTLMSILQAVSFMLGQGAGTNISRRLAVKDNLDASIYASVSFFLTIIIGSLFLIIGLLFLDPLMILLGSTKTVLPYARVYGGFILLSAPALMASLSLNNIFRYEGKTFLGMIGLSLGAIINMIGDPILIYGFKMGIYGAGLSTLIGQYISFIILVLLFIYKSDCKLKFKYFVNGFNHIWMILKNGFPSLIRQGLNSISSGILNNCAKIIGDECLSAMSIVSRIQHFLVSICIGIGQGFQPVAGFNYEVKNYQRLRKAFTFTITISLLLLILLGGTSFIFARPLIFLFIDNEMVVEIGQYAFRWTCFGLLFLPFSISSNMLFQSTGQSLKASFLACLRGGLCFIPIILLLSNSWGMKGIQVSTGISDLLSGVLSIPFFVLFFKRIPKADFYKTETP